MDSLKTQSENMTDSIMQVIENKRAAQKDIAAIYRLAILNDIKNTDWPRINAAIVARYSRSGLENVKRMAWTGLELGTL